MRLSREVTGWAFLAEVEGVRHAGLAVGLAGISPFSTGGGAGGSLFARAYARGLPVLPSLDALPFSGPLSPRWCVTQDEEGVLSVLDPDGALFVHDLDVGPPAGWWEAADASGSVMLVVSHVLPATDDPLGALAFETRRGKVCAGVVRFGEPDRQADGEPTVTFVIDPVGVLMELALYVCDRIMSLDEAKRRAREVEETRQALAEHGAMSAEAMVDLLFRDEFLDHRGLVEFMYVYWRLVAEVADACAREAAWRAASFQAVEAGVQLVADRCDRAVFEESDALAVRLIDGRSDTADLEAALLAAARLRMATRGQEYWTPAQRSAALLHAAAHARDRRQPAWGLTLLRQAGDNRSEEVRLLTADLYYQSAEQGEQVAGPVPFPWGYYTYAALSYASLGFEELAQACLVPLVQQLGNLRGDALRNALYAIIVDAPNFDTAGMPGLGAILRDLVHSAVWQLTVESETLPMGLILGLHQAGKGSELGAWWRIEGPLVLPAHIQHFLGKVRDREEPTAAGGALPNLLNAVDADHRPGGHDDTQIARNLRWRISAFIDDELRRRSTPLIDAQHLWAKVHDLLDDRTVLLTWFLPTAVNGATVLLAVTRQGRELVVHLGEGPDGNGDRHPDADRVEAIRTEIARDPLFGDVTPEGSRLLESAGLPIGGSELWDKWRAQGKDRILAWPHGALHYLPLPLCRRGGRLIADDWTVTTIAGLEALAPADVPARKGRTVVLASAAGGVPFGLHAEPALEEHARKVAEAVGTEALTGRAATRDRLRAEMSVADVVHIAVHGTLDEDAPWMHCLYLAPDGDDDGRVFAYDFLDVDLRGLRLVTLAACESALGRFDRGDNVRGIPSALITAGAQAVVGCLWPVRPEPATYFYHHLHQEVARGTDPEQAFRSAQLATRVAHPPYRDWGAFVFVHGRNKGATP
ncbi:CHAT domain-containing protein [Streptomyces sp. CC228A]|uniref:CHAT domain-containing protein n=1 Tax=Streptomyces sp. CC228A TaxID=2898186 RepID=UPI001F2184DB|nr:CHAT domain-containing protein [Streptomyces sp. CC228A]